MNYVIDTEFHDDGRQIDLISIAIIDEVGKYYYAVSNQFSVPRARRVLWIKENVLDQLESRDSSVWKSRLQIKHEVLNFIGKNPPTFWAWKASYDWVGLMQLFGPAWQRPEGWPVYIRDIHDTFLDLGSPSIDHITNTKKHHALFDADWARNVLNHLKGLKR